MLKLRIAYPEGPLEVDSNLTKDEVKEVRFIQIKPDNGSALGTFKGRAGHRATIDMGVTAWRTVVLPDDRDPSGIQGFELFDTKQEIDPLRFSAGDPLFFMAEQAGEKREITKGPDRHLTLRNDFKSQFAWIGEVGVNDLGYQMVATVEVPAASNNRQNRELLNDYAQHMGKKFKTEVMVKIKPIGYSVHIPDAHPLMADELIAREGPAIAGQQSVQPDPHVQDTNPTTFGGVTPMSEGPHFGGEPLEIGEPHQQYGSQETKHD